MSQSHSLTHVTFSFFDHVSVVNGRFGRSLRFCDLKFNKEVIYDGCRSENSRYQWLFMNFKRVKLLQSSCVSCSIQISQKLFNDEVSSLLCLQRDISSRVSQRQIGYSYKIVQFSLSKLVACCEKISWWNPVYCSWSTNTPQPHYFLFFILCFSCFYAYFCQVRFAPQGQERGLVRARRVRVSRRGQN